MTRKPAAVLVVLSLAVLALALVPTAGFAAKGGNGANPTRGGGGGGATFTFDLTAVVVGQQYQVSVSGLGPNAWVTVGAHFPWPETAYWCSKWTDNTGNWTCTYTAMAAGDILHDAYQMGNNGSFRLKGSATLTVSSASP